MIDMEQQQKEQERPVGERGGVGRESKNNLA